MRSNSRIREDFIMLLDNQFLEPADAIIVLRNHKTALNNERLTHALNLMGAGFAPIMLMSQDINTKGEAVRMVEIIKRAGWKNIILVTHKSHSYRAFLTFVQALDSNIVHDDGGWWHKEYNLICSSVETSPEWLESYFEMRKIKEYNKRGDVASYERGLEWLI